MIVHLYTDILASVTVINVLWCSVDKNTEKSTGTI